MAKPRISTESYILRTALLEFLAAALSLVLSLSLLPEHSGLPLVVAVYLAVAQAGYGGWLIVLRSRHQSSGWAPVFTRTFKVLLGGPIVLGQLGFLLLMLRPPGDHSVEAVLVSIVLLIVGLVAAMLCVFRTYSAASVESDGADR